MKLEDYAELLRWLAGKSGPCVGAEDGVGPPSMLRRLNLDPVEFADLVRHFGERFFTFVGCPASLQAEARRRGRRRFNGPGKRSLAPCRSG